MDFLPQGFIKHGSEAYVTKALGGEPGGGSGEPGDGSAVWVTQLNISDLELSGEQAGGLPVLQGIRQGAVVENIRRGVADLNHQPAN
jgi:hypothetical protein